MSGECHDERCITCSDELLAMVVMDVDPATGIARGTIDGADTEVAIDLIGDVTIGDVLLCHGGVALQHGPDVRAGV
ncbi:MAG: hydrogenase maturation protein [Candidatus Dormiibacterota bacterium]